MKKVVSVSLGSSTRDHQATVKLLGEDFDISRVGTDGKLDEAIKKVQELDGKVDAIYRDEFEIKRVLKVSPALQAGLTDHVWDLDELILA